MTVRIEIGHNEIGDADESELDLPGDMTRLLAELGFPAPNPIPVMKLPYQIAQKLHAVTTVGADRPHDLVDLQLMCSQSQIDLAATKAICVRLFDYRRMQPWPPKVTRDEEWETHYAEAGRGLTVLPTVDEAIKWANALIARIDSSAE